MEQNISIEFVHVDQCFRWPTIASPRQASVDTASSTDSKELRKQRQQQLQQKFRKEMEAKRLEQKEAADTKAEDMELLFGEGGDGLSCRTLVAPLAFSLRSESLSETQHFLPATKTF